MDVSEYGDGAAWFRGSIIGKGGFGSVYLATLKNPTSKYSCFPPLMAVKSAEVSASGSIQKEKEVLTNLKGCPYLIKCFGEETTIGSNGVMAYNLLLEYGSGGTLSDRIEKSGGGGLAECEARVYTRSILRGLNHIHGNGYVHCDLKPENILLVPNSGAGIRAKIGDFGLAKRERNSKKSKILEPYWRGTPMYLSPEAVVDKVQESPSDIWALGCIVLYMLTGNLPWEGKKSEEIIRKIGTRGRLPKIPNELSKEAKDFLKGCFVRRSVFRHTSEMLLHHPFVEVLENGDAVEESVEFEFNCDVYSDEDSFSSWSEEELEEVENIEGVMGFDQSNETSKRAPLHSLRKRKQHCPVSLVIPVGIYQS
ncbi:hypothetical protein ABFS82_09G082900 [Erythranthe guttata]|uniref:mitogen-activated protein kinase kinase kinase NPK1-like n=1 Tax=Erythranthe guttata TaxID=4155 RepID=UPI00064DBE8A|nr:PREDICTED: mitogen-activated protein kinase kinase kinase NPK1-like [Erythranthe guttata]|eukprot:XP_012856241.1 PREDICTED: mitogen-activated protein kinase kinase kinase NPK1-like [Erythranthe guttata]